MRFEAAFVVGTVTPHQKLLIANAPVTSIATVVLFPATERSVAGVRFRHPSGELGVPLPRWQDPLRSPPAT